MCQRDAQDAPAAVNDDALGCTTPPPFGQVLKGPHFMTPNAENRKKKHSNTQLYPEEPDFQSRISSDVSLLFQGVLSSFPIRKSHTRLTSFKEVPSLLNNCCDLCLLRCCNFNPVNSWRLAQNWPRIVHGIVQLHFRV